MSERRKQLHRERAARHQAGLRKLNADAQISSNNVAVSAQTVTQTTAPSLQTSRYNVAVSAQTVTQSTAPSLQTSRVNPQASKLPYVENNIISSWNTAFNTVEEPIHSLVPTRPVALNWKNCALMKKFHSRTFSKEKQQVLDNKYKYYNPFTKNDKELSYGGFDPSNLPNSSFTSVGYIGSYNDTYYKLFNYWKPLFLPSLNTKMAGFRLIWTTSLSWHIVGLKIFSLVEENTEDFMFLIGEFLVGKSIYITDEDLNNKSQYESEHRNKEKDCIYDMREIALCKRLMKVFSFYQYRYFCGIIRQYYKERIEDHNCKFLLQSNELAQMCFGNLNESFVNCSFGSEWKLFYMRKEAMTKTFEFIDDHIDDYPLDSDSEANAYSSSPYFSEDENCKILGMHKDKLKEMLFVLMFSGFETVLKCPCSKVYSDLIFLYGCPLPENSCKNQSYSNMSAFMQHFSNKGCVFHKVIFTYLSYLSELSGIGHAHRKKRNRRNRK